jgi:hypothetical protein
VEILRIRVDGRIWNYDDVAAEWQIIGVKLMGPGMAGLRGEVWRGLPSPPLMNPRARFYFTKLGWHEVGQHVYAEVKRRGHVVSVIRRRGPSRSQVVYRDAWQVALLPRRRRDSR